MDMSSFRERFAEVPFATTYHRLLLVAGTLLANQLQALGGRGLAHVLTPFPPGFPGEEFGGIKVKHGLESAGSALGFPPPLELFRCVQSLRS